MKDKHFEFKAGDIVEFGGLKGKVINCDDYEYYPIAVEFEKMPGSYLRFTADGRFYKEHTKPLLNLIERPRRRKVKKTLWVNVYHDREGYFTSTALYESEAGAYDRRCDLINYATTVPIEFEDYEEGAE